MTDVSLRPFEASDRDWLVAQHQALYARDEGFDETFGPLVGQILDGFIISHDPQVERGWIAQNADGPIGSIFCVTLDDQTAKLRLFLISPEGRGQGLGRRMLEACMSFAREAGYKRMQLWTHESHRAAGALYASAGWELVGEKRVHSFGRENVEQTWTITL